MERDTEPLSRPMACAQRVAALRVSDNSAGRPSAAPTLERRSARRSVLLHEVPKALESHPVGGEDNTGLQSKLANHPIQNLLVEVVAT